MGVSYFGIEFERDTYNPGQLVSGRVLLRLDSPKDIREERKPASPKPVWEFKGWMPAGTGPNDSDLRLAPFNEEKYTDARPALLGSAQINRIFGPHAGIGTSISKRDASFDSLLHSTSSSSRLNFITGVEFKLCGQTKFHWTSDESYTDSEGKTQYRTITHSGKEQYISSKMALAGGKGTTFELPIGEYNYPFAVMLPTNIPSTYNGEYGGVSYFGKAKLDIPWGVDKKEKRFFQVINLLNLNSFPNLQTPCKDEKSKTFCCCCCASGPLTIVALIPRSGYAYHESIPITVEVDNASNVKINKVDAKLHRKIRWRASDDTKSSETKIKSLRFGEVDEGASKTWSELMPLGPDRYPNLSGCNIITITHQLEIEADASGPHSDLDIKFPITIGDIAFNESEVSNVNEYPGAQPVPGGMGPPAHALGFNDPSAGVPNSGIGFQAPAATGQYPPAGYTGAPLNPGASGPYPTAAYPSQPGAPSFPQQPGASPYPAQQPGAAPYPAQQPGASPYPAQQPGASPYPAQQPGASPYPAQQPGASPYPAQQPGASPYLPQQPGAFSYPSQQPGAAPYAPPLQPGAPVSYSSAAPDAPLAPEGDLSLGNNDLFRGTAVDIPRSNFLGDEHQSKDEKASQFMPLLPQNTPQDK